jgi:16S rRNA G966 N2-methylase RsmD
VLGARVARGIQTLADTPGFVPFDIVVLDPPYDTSPAEALDGADRTVAPGGVLVLEHSRKQTPPAASGGLVRMRQVTSGDSALTLYQV